VAQAPPDKAAAALAQPSPATCATLHERLFAWFHANARDLPWRYTRNPYHVLVAEMMLQQTQVERVVPRYHAFLAAYPHLHDLAAAPTADVIRLWAGLGYNRRAVNLQRTARLITETYGGHVPQSVAELRRLPGIGAYTAGALACFAFEQDVAFLDTNIRRVLRRCLVGEEPPAPTEKALLELAHTLLPPGRGWLWNQALMELGALACTAASPACPRCPWGPYCRAYQHWQASPPDSTAAYAQARRPARRVAERREPYHGSNRYYRGRIVEVLRHLPERASIPLAELGAAIKGYTAQDEAWLRTLVAGLVRDGLAEWDSEHAQTAVHLVGG
jgi:A/G-specific adenine glycosylase